MSRCAPLLAVLLLAPSLGFAQSRTIDENVTYGYAQVMRASPVYQTFRTRTPEQRCEGPAGTRCRTVEVERTERRLTGYDVEYQYKGEKYMSRLDSDPGNRLRVRVSVTPDVQSLGYRCNDRHELAKSGDGYC